MEHLSIKMFGEFSIQIGSQRISDSDNRSRKVWILLAYLICRRGRTISRKELIDLLWGDDSSNNPENALKTTFHRVRTLLNQLYPTAGHDLLLWQNGGYTWNTDIPMTVDTDEFDRLCQANKSDNAVWLSSALEALKLYQGDFLGNLSSEAWVLPITAYYHNLYIQTILDAAPLLSAQGRYEEIASICRKALTVEPYHEPLHRQLMQALIAMGDQKGAAAVYEELQQQLFSELGIKPSDETKALYRTATHSLSTQIMPMDLILENLQETNASPGALRCEFDYFKILCHAEARAMLRSGKATHLALLSVTASGNQLLSKRSLEKAMEHLSEQIACSLRRGDTFTQCSISQYIIMLPQANYENSCMVCQRVINAFIRRHPHSPAKIQFVVQPLSANLE